jgi:hypothetical protein
MKSEIIKTETKNLRLFTIGDVRVQDKCFIFNGAHIFNQNKLFAIHAPLGNFSTCLAVLWAENESDALEEAANRGLLDFLLLHEEDLSEEELEESTRLGNAGEPFDLDNVSIQEIPEATWQADWQFVFALGRAVEGAVETANDL